MGLVSGGDLEKGAAMINCWSLFKIIEYTVTTCPYQLTIKERPSPIYYKENKI